MGVGVGGAVDVEDENTVVFYQAADVEEVDEDGGFADEDVREDGGVNFAEVAGEEGVLDHHLAAVWLYWRGLWDGCYLCYQFALPKLAID